MNVLAPFSLKSEVVPLVEAGASELYCGVVPEELSRRWGTLELLNRRRGYDANLWSFADLGEAIAAAHERHVPVFVTLNRHYSEDAYPLLHEILTSLQEVDADGVIVVDLGLLQLLRERPYGFRHVIVGTGGATLNAETVAFYGALGATRVRILMLICCEAGIVGILGGILGLLLGHLLGCAGSVFMERLMGQGINWTATAWPEWLYLGMVVVLSALAGLVPALAAYRTPVATNLVAG